MKKILFLCFCLTFSFACNVSAETYRSQHFIIYSDLDPRYIKILQANIEAFYNNLQGRFFKTGWLKPLKIYYSKNHSETFKLPCKHGYNEKGSNVKARTSYAKQNSQKALQCYQKALEYADFDEHKYELYYSIAQCYDSLKDR